MSWEHRAQARVLTVVPALLASDQGHAIGQLVNLSPAGGVIATAHAPEPGQPLHLLIHVPSLNLSIHIHRAVVRWRALGLCGVEFVHLHPLHHTRLHHYVHQLDPGPARRPRKQPPDAVEET